MAAEVVLVADAGPGIGTGHVMRCITLGVALRGTGVAAVLVSHALPGPLAARARGLGIELFERASGLEVPAITESLGSDRPRLVVLDRYGMSRAFLEALDATGTPSFVIDDNRESPILRPLAILNQNLHANPAMYADVDPSVIRLLGPRFALVRPEVVRRRDQVGPDERAGIAVALGGADTLGLTPTVVDALKNLNRGPVMAAGGLLNSTNDRAEAISNPDQLAAALARSAVAVVGAGTTVWEAACLGVPAVALVVADNQAAMAEACDQGGIAVVIDARNGLDVHSVAASVAQLLDDASRRSAMGARGRSLIDGQGADRVATRIAELLGLR